MSELGSIVIWPKHLQHVDAITSELESQFKIIEHYDIQWSAKVLYQNFYRFYGDRLSTKSIKEKAVDGSVFRLIIFEDVSPKYAFRPTARGVEKVNANFFDLKKFFRKKFHTRFGIHGSNDEMETSRDLSLLLGVNVDDYKRKYGGSWSGKVKNIKRDVTGANGWDSLEHFFYFINAVEPYLILRNYNDLNDGLEIIDDIDFLVVDRKRFALFSNATKMSKGTERANYKIAIKGKDIDIDLRYVGDDYYDQFWQQDCMNNRMLHSNGFYIMDSENQYFSLLYHVLIHKTKISNKYKDLSGLTLVELQTRLYKFMHGKGYNMVEPKDITLRFNKGNGGDIKFNRPRRLRNKKGVIGFLKKGLYRLNNLVHFRRGPD